MHEAATHLPPLSLATNAAAALGAIDDHIENLANGIFATLPDQFTPLTALPFIKSKVAAFFGN
jgi:hypothetical protein